MGSHDMRPGNVRIFRPGRAIVLATGIWAKRDHAKWIRIDITGPKNFHTTVTNDPDSERYHRTLFRDLCKVLLTNDCWPFGDDGGETERSRRA